MMKSVIVSGEGSGSAKENHIIKILPKTRLEQEVTASPPKCTWSFSRLILTFSFCRCCYKGAAVRTSSGEINQDRAEINSFLP
jgi:hypothetical protein